MGDGGCELLGLTQQRLGLQKVDDVDAAVLAVDEPAHLRVPAAGLVAEVHAGLQQLSDPNLGHGSCSLNDDAGRKARRRARNPAGWPGRAVSRTPAGSCDVE